MAAETAGEPASNGGSSYQEMLRLENAWTKARMHSMSLERQLLERGKEAALSPELKRLREEWQQSTDEVSYYQERLPYKKALNDMVRSDLESLRSQKAELAPLSSAAAPWVPPEFRIATRDIDAGADGYLSVSKGTVLVATNLEDEHFYGFELHQPSHRGWVPRSGQPQRLVSRICHRGFVFSTNQTSFISRRALLMAGQESSTVRINAEEISDAMSCRDGG
eukprot:Skav211561  [mRNA]  locus=scaffold2228:156132:156797:+ [translate_table: standard]